MLFGLRLQWIILYCSISIKAYEILVRNYAKKLNLSFDFIA